MNGGSIAIGHPLGASGARIATTLLHEMQKRDGPVRIGHDVCRCWSGKSRHIRKALGIDCAIALRATIRRRALPRMAMSKTTSITVQEVPHEALSIEASRRETPIAVAGCGTNGHGSTRQATYVAHFQYDEWRPCQMTSWFRLNNVLPKDIAVQTLCMQVPDNFNARFDANCANVSISNIDDERILLTVTIRYGVLPYR